MNIKCLAVFAALAVMLVAATAFSTTDSAFADKKRHDDKKRSGYGSGGQALAQDSECGNGFISVANQCQEIGAQNQGKENNVDQKGNQKINVDVDLDNVIPVPPDVVGCPENTVWDITIRGAAEEGGVPVGTVICLTEGLGNHPATVLLTPPIVVDVNTNQPNVANCNAPGQQVAQVTSGIPPNPLSMNSFLCATVDLP